MPRSISFADCFKEQTPYGAECTRQLCIPTAPSARALAPGAIHTLPKVIAQHGVAERPALPRSGATADACRAHPAGNALVVVEHGFERAHAAVRLAAVIVVEHGVELALAVLCAVGIDPTTRAGAATEAVVVEAGVGPV